MRAVLSRKVSLPQTSYVNNENTFTLQSPGLVVPATGANDANGEYQGLFGQNSLNFERALTLDSNARTTPNQITARIIQGSFTETIGSPSAPHLATEDRGTFHSLTRHHPPPFRNQPY